MSEQLEFEFCKENLGTKPHNPNRAPTLLEVAQMVLFCSSVTCPKCEKALREAIIREYEP